MNESNLMREIQTKTCQVCPNVRLFRNNVGTGWQGIGHPNGTQITLKNYRPIQFGLCVGSSDLIGFKTVEITPEMVGQKLAVFVAVEVKTATGKASKVQKQFINTVQKMGGFAAICRTVDDAIELLK